jgi:FMNH2-dependent dimethyl sulfone monooxygenase
MKKVTFCEAATAGAEFVCFSIPSTEAEALEQLEAIVAGADSEIVRSFGEQVKNAGQSTREKIGMWANSDYANLVQPNDGFSVLPN